MKNDRYYLMYDNNNNLWGGTTDINTAGNSGLRFEEVTEKMYYLTFPPKNKEITFAGIVTVISSVGLIVFVLLYMIMKTILFPEYSKLEKRMAGLLYEYVDASFLSIIASSTYAEIPEARSDLLYELGFYFPEEK